MQTGFYETLKIFLLNNLLLSIFLSGCSQVPIQAMSDARQALQAAHNVQAKKYTPALFAQAQLYLEQAEYLMATGEYAAAETEAMAARNRAVAAYELSATLNQAQQIWDQICMDYQDEQTAAFLAAAISAAQSDRDHMEVLPMAKAVLRHVRAALNRAQLTEAEHLLTIIRAKQSSLSAKQAGQLTAAEAAFMRHEGQKARALAQVLYNMLE